MLIINCDDLGSSRAANVAVYESNPYEFYVAAATGGLWKTSDNGVTWTVVFENLGLANNAPFAAAFAMVPLGIMAVYLLLMKRLGAFESL